MLYHIMEMFAKYRPTVALSILNVLNQLYYLRQVENSEIFFLKGELFRTIKQNEKILELICRDSVIEMDEPEITSDDDTMVEANYTYTFKKPWSKNLTYSGFSFGSRNVLAINLNGFKLDEEINSLEKALYGIKNGALYGNITYCILNNTFYYNQKRCKLQRKSAMHYCVTNLFKNPSQILKSMDIKANNERNFWHDEDKRIIENSVRNLNKRLAKELGISDELFIYNGINGIEKSKRETVELNPIFQNNVVLITKIPENQ